MAVNYLDSPLVVYVESQSGDGEGDREITKIKSWSIESDYLSSVDSFEFTMVDNDPRAFDMLECAPVLLTVGGAPQLVGRIDRTMRGDDGEVSMSCQGRDYMADLLECNIDPTFVIREKMTLGEVVLGAAVPVGILNIASNSDVHAFLDARMGVPGKTKRSKDNRSKPPHTASLADFKPDIGQGIYEFLKPICARHLCTLQATLKRNTVLIGAPQYDQEPAYAIVRSLNGVAEVNNIVRATASRDYSSFPTHTIVQGQGAPRTGEATANATENIDTWAEAQHFGGELARKLSDITWSGRRWAQDPDGAVLNFGLPIDKIYRLKVFRDDKARGFEEINAAAKRIFCEHLKKTLEYRVTLKGHMDPLTGAIWTVNTIVQVDDDVCNVHEPLWIQSRKLSFGNNGPETELVCIRPEAFDFNAKVQPVAKKGSGKPKPRPPASDRFYNPQNYAGNLGGEVALPGTTDETGRNFGAPVNKIPDPAFDSKGRLKFKPSF